MLGSRPRPVPGFLFIVSPRIIQSCIPRETSHSAISSRIVAFGLSETGVSRVGCFTIATAWTPVMDNHSVYVVELGSCGRLSQEPVESTRRRLRSLFLSHAPTRAGHRLELRVTSIDPNRLTADRRHLRNPEAYA